MQYSRAGIASLVVLLLLASRSSADAVLATFQNQKTPSAGEPRAIGEYSAGCVQGAKALPLDGDGYQVMHESRVRYFGHPSLVDFIQTLGRATHAAGLVDLLVGDLAQPRGGRALGGHASHQSGLDVDLWYWHPKQASKRTLTKAERENTKARSVLDGKTQGIAAAWSARVETLLRLTASDARVARVFVHPLIKRQLCAQVQGERAWLGKIRPWFGHDDHFHVRLACPTDSRLCVAQPDPPAGDGCVELDYWLSAEAEKERAEGRKEYQQKVARSPKLPPECEALLKN